MSSTALENKYQQNKGRLYLTGVQALAKLPMIQALRDKAEGKKTAGFISGYRGSPLGAFDQALWKAKDHLEAAGVKFQPGLNEELAATMVWGSQQAVLSPGCEQEGVFGLWYGKGPGLDRAMDAIKHGNSIGTSALGGVLAVVGDDHAARSSTLPHQSDHMFMAAMIPTLNPAGVQEYIDFGLHGWAMSRYSGCWVGFIAVADTVESGASVEVDIDRVKIELPTPAEFHMPPEGLSIRWPDDKMQQEARLQDFKVYAALAYARKNKLNRITVNPAKAKLGIVATGKAWLDTLQALEDLGISDALCESLGIRLLKLGMSWPLESEIVKTFAAGLDEILVVEEKRPIVEYLIKEQLYNWEEGKRPKVVGKFDEKGEWALPHGDWLLPAKGELTPTSIALVIASRIARFHQSATMTERVQFLKHKLEDLKKPRDLMPRAPHYCSGCPHNTSTKVPEGSRALGGIGCHYMATWIYPSTQTFSQMGGEGVGWAGIAPFTKENHIFANLGDGTYFHSGSLAIRQAIATGVNITYKILYNDAVAMTGGQPVDGTLKPADLIWQVHAEHPAAIAVVTDDPSRYIGLRLPEGVEVYPREELDQVQDLLKKTPGCTIMVYDQTCAAEKRRRRKKGTYPNPAKRVFINPAVCEGCGDCGKKSNCLSILPLETEWGRKREIDQHSCNKDYSCIEGFCPSFVTIYGGELKKPERNAEHREIPEPVLPTLFQPWNILMAGVGGTGVVTVGQTLGMAAHLAGLSVTTLDQTGLAQKGGAVSSHLRIASQSIDLKAPRVADGECDLLLAADLATAVQVDTLAKLNAKRSFIVANADVLPSSAFLHQPNMHFKDAAMLKELSKASGENMESFHALKGAIELFGEEIAANFMLAGFAWQRGKLPIPRACILEAIEINGASTQMNKEAFEAGRRAAFNPNWLTQVLADARAQLKMPLMQISQSFEERFERQLQELKAWGNDENVSAHRIFLDKVKGRLPEDFTKREEIIDTIMRTRFKLAAYKDEYEVARLFGEQFKAALKDQIKGSFRMEFHLASPLFAKPKANGEIKKRTFGPWMGVAMQWLAKGKVIRGSLLDPFSYFHERLEEHWDAPLFERDILSALDLAHAEQADCLIALAANGLEIKGFGPIKQANRKKAMKEREIMLAKLRDRDAIWQAKPKTTIMLKVVHEKL